MGYIVSEGDIPGLLVGGAGLELRRVSFRLYGEYGSAEFSNEDIVNLRKMVDWMAARPEFREVLERPVETFFCWECGSEHRRLSER